MIGGGRSPAGLGVWATHPPTYQIRKVLPQGKIESKEPENGGRYEVHKLFCALRSPPVEYRPATKRSPAAWTVRRAGEPQPPPPPLRHTRAHTHRHGGISRLRAPPRGLGAVNSPAGLVTGHPGTATQSGPAGKRGPWVGDQVRPSPNPTQPKPPPGASLAPKVHGAKGAEDKFVLRVQCSCSGRSCLGPQAQSPSCGGGGSFGDHASRVGGDRRVFCGDCPWGRGERPERGGKWAAKTPATTSTTPSVPATGLR